MTSREEAMRLARQWAAGGRADAAVEVTLWEFDLGFVAWRAAPSGPGGQSAPPAALGTSRVVVDKQTGELTVWPSFAPEVIAERYRASRRVAAGPREEVRRPREEVRPDPAGGRVQVRVDLQYRLARPDGTMSPTTLPRSWYFDVPVRRHTTEAWTELLQRIFYDANVALRRREPRDGSWYALDSVDVSPVDLAAMLGWDGTATRDSAAAHLPWMLPPGATWWESASRLIVDDAGRYDGMEGEDFAELVLYRALADGRVDEPAARAFLDRLYPGHGADCLADRGRRLANIVEIRPTTDFRREPGSTPWMSGPPEPADVAGQRPAAG